MRWKEVVAALGLCFVTYAPVQTRAEDPPAQLSPLEVTAASFDNILEDSYPVDINRDGNFDFQVWWSISPRYELISYPRILRPNDRYEPKFEGDTGGVFWDSIVARAVITLANGSSLTNRWTHIVDPDQKNAPTFLGKTAFLYEQYFIFRGKVTLLEYQQLPPGAHVSLQEFLKPYRFLRTQKMYPQIPDLEPLVTETYYQDQKTCSSQEQNAVLGKKEESWNIPGNENTRAQACKRTTYYVKATGLQEDYTVIDYFNEEGHFIDFRKDDGNFTDADFIANQFGSDGFADVILRNDF